MWSIKTVQFSTTNRQKPVEAGEATVTAPVFYVQGPGLNPQYWGTNIKIVATLSQNVLSYVVIQKYTTDPEFETSSTTAL